MINNPQHLPSFTFVIIHTLVQCMVAHWHQYLPIWGPFPIHIKIQRQISVFPIQTVITVKMRDADILALCHHLNLYNVTLPDYKLQHCSHTSKQLIFALLHITYIHILSFFWAECRANFVGQSANRLGHHCHQLHLRFY